MERGEQRAAPRVDLFPVNTPGTEREGERGVERERMTEGKKRRGERERGRKREAEREGEGKRQWPCYRQRQSSMILQRGTSLVSSFGILQSSHSFTNSSYLAIFSCYPQVF